MCFAFVANRFEKVIHKPESQRPGPTPILKKLRNIFPKPETSFVIILIDRIQYQFFIQNTANATKQPLITTNNPSNTKKRLVFIHINKL